MKQYATDARHQISGCGLEIMMARVIQTQLNAGVTLTMGSLGW